ncbi:MAG: hypothetical protein EXX96DRAFT_563351 [Benjaminiella poitrasii]|nr:MAG: hypothetical protein EXX96DRAFT_563351 [Benjaminiella poitrasii]
MGGFIYSFISFFLHSQFPTALTPYHVQQIFKIVTTSQWCIWNSYWQHVIHAVPFHSSPVLNTIYFHLTILLEPHQYD